MTKALITGISGQDGSYLAELLLTKNYEVHGIIRRSSVTENQRSRLLPSIVPHINLVYGDLLDVSSLDKVIRDIRPDEVYNLAAQSHVRISYDIPQYTVAVNTMGVVNLLEIIRNIGLDTKIYQASSSEMFGNSVDDDLKQRETTPMHPVSPYGCSKLFSYSFMRNYRHAYGMFASNGILFNHESPRRGSNFVTTKIVKTAWQIKRGLTDKLELGNLDSFRDWGHSKDYVAAMHAILQHTKPDDFVVATGKAHSVREFCNIVFSRLGMNYENYVVQNSKYVRPEELNYLCGDSTKAKQILGWKPTFTFEQLVEDMVGNLEDVT